MIHIVKLKEPECLKELRETQGTKYDDLQGVCLSSTRGLLHNEQNGLCAYCQRQLKSSVFIEHYIPQSKNSLLELEYTNFLGVCSGKYYLDKITGQHIEFCSCSRGNKSLLVNPLDEDSIDTLFYDEKNRICSTDNQINDDLNKTLNLNFAEICEDRKNSYDNFLQSIFSIGQKMNLSKIEIYEKALRSIGTQTKEFHGFLVYRITKIIEFQKGE